MGPQRTARIRIGGIQSREASERPTPSQKPPTDIPAVGGFSFVVVGVRDWVPPPRPLEQLELFDRSMRPGVGRSSFSRAGDVFPNVDTFDAFLSSHAERWV